MVVRKSMQTRYYIEMFFFFGVVCAFQAYLLFFISDYNLLTEKYQSFLDAKEAAADDAKVIEEINKRQKDIVAE